MTHPAGISLLLATMIVSSCSAPDAADPSQGRATESYRSAAASPDVPEWAKDAVWYQVFPERFRNGDPSNDPTVDVVAKSWPYRSSDAWTPTRWTKDWYHRDDWEVAATDDFYGGVQMRRYGGDLAGLVEALPYLDTLGVTAIYLNPVFDAPSLHKYDGSTFHHIDVHFGPDPAGDRALIALEDPADPSTWLWTSADRLFLSFVADAHVRGMRVIVDGVFNHMGTESFVFQDILANQQASKFADWIEVISWDDPATPDSSEFDYRGWMGVRSLPELTENDQGLIPPVRDYVFASVARWMDPDSNGDPSDGIDGWRLDVAEMVDPDFWRAFREHVRSIRPDAYLTGEVWWEDWPNHLMFNAAPWLQGDVFDSVMNYRWARITRRLFIGSDLDAGESYGPTRFFDDLAELRADYPPETSFAMMNTIGSHDTDRPASQVANPGVQFDHRASVRDNDEYAIRRPTPDEWATLRLMLVHQFSTIGAPHLFYGDEAGMWGGDDPDERKPMVWPDLEYDAEASHPFGVERSADPVEFDHDLFRFYQSLIAARGAHPALRRGSFEPLAADDASKTLVYRRTFGRDRVWVVFNLSDSDREVAFDRSIPTDPNEETADLPGLVDLLGGTEATVSGLTATARLSPRSAALFVSR